MYIYICACTCIYKSRICIYTHTLFVVEAAKRQMYSLYIYMILQSSLWTNFSVFTKLPSPAKVLLACIILLAHAGNVTTFEQARLGAAASEHHFRSTPGNKQLNGHMICAGNRILQKLMCWTSKSIWYTTYGTNGLQDCSWPLTGLQLR